MSATSLKGIENFGDNHLTNTINSSIIMFFDWAFIDKGAYFNVQIPTSGAFGGNKHILRPVNREGYDSGQVWEAFRGNWIWESGLSVGSPIPISGIFVDNVFHPVNSDFYIDYPHGQVVFESGISTRAQVHLAYSHKWVDFVNADDIELFRLHKRSFRLDESDFVSRSGNWLVTRENVVQLPLVGVEAYWKYSQGHELGGSQRVYHNINFYVLGEDSHSVNKIAAAIASQKEKTIYLVDFDRMAAENNFPLNYLGSPTSGALSYPDLVKPTGENGFRYTRDVAWGKLTFTDTKTQKINLNGLSYTIVTAETEIVATKI